MSAARTGYILETLGMDDHTINLGLTAAWLHDLGNTINRVDHSQSGALMSFYLLDKMGIAAEDIAPVIRAIGNHDEVFGVSVRDLTAALIIADKSDVRRSRVQDEVENFDIHDRVNYSVKSSHKQRTDIDVKYIISEGWMLV
ncbi:MAG: hypothetical protein K6A37_10510 [Saccharofermentans sp.]|nr:hypothetical protein [Saccharofermentans sp.]